MDLVGENIRRIRRDRGLSQKELAALAEMDRSNLSKLEAGDYTWTKANLTRIADALQVEISVFFSTVHPGVPLRGYVQAAAPPAEPPSENWRILNVIDSKVSRILSVLEEAAK